MFSWWYRRLSHSRSYFPLCGHSWVNRCNYSCLSPITTGPNVINISCNIKSIPPTYIMTRSRSVVTPTRLKGGRKCILLENLWPIPFLIGQSECISFNQSEKGCTKNVLKMYTSVLSLAIFRILEVEDGEGGDWISC